MEARGKMSAVSPDQRRDSSDSNSRSTSNSLSDSFNRISANWYSSESDEDEEQEEQEERADAAKKGEGGAEEEHRPPSELHIEGQCKPCSFFAKGRCRNGLTCVYCHEDHGAPVEASRRPNKVKRKAIKDQIRTLQSMPDTKTRAKALVELARGEGDSYAARVMEGLGIDLDQQKAKAAAAKASSKKGPPQRKPNRSGPVPLEPGLLETPWPGTVAQSRAAGTGAAGSSAAGSSAASSSVPGSSRARSIAKGTGKSTKLRL